MPTSADLLIKDSPADTGAEPSGTPFWESPDIVVRQQDDGIFAYQPALRGEKNFIYVRARNIGQSDAHNVRVEMRAVAYPGTEFVYPYDWTAQDATHIKPFGVDAHEQKVVAGAPTKIFKFRLDPPDVATLYGWEQVHTHPCLLAEVHADEDTTAPGFLVHVWERNNLAQRNITTTSTMAMKRGPLPFAFVVGSPINPEPYVELVVDRSRLSRGVELLLEPSEEAVIFPALGEAARRSGRAVSRVLDRTRLGVSLGGAEAIVTLEAGSSFEIANGGCPDAIPLAGAEWVERQGRRLLAIRGEKAVVGVPKAAGELRQMSLRLATVDGPSLGKPFTIRISQRNTRGQVVGGVTFTSGDKGE